VKESDAQRAIIDYLSMRRHFCWRNNSGAFKTEHGSFVRAGIPGSPDIVCCIDGCFIGVEVNGAKGELSDAQREFKSRLEKAGGRYFVARSIDDVQKQGL
jgi:hypothetical protein